VRAVRGAEGVVDVDVSEFGERRAKHIHILLISLDLQHSHRSVQFTVL